jgi:hypothetical protein
MNSDVKDGRIYQPKHDSERIVGRSSSFVELEIAFVGEAVLVIPLSILNTSPVVLEERPT